MKKYILITLFLPIMLLSSVAGAQDKIYSLSLKQHEIEQAIHKSLRSFLSEKDYVVKVTLEGTKKVEAARPDSLQFKESQGEALPGFEMESKTALAKITDVVGNSYWQIKTMRIDLIMHKEISPSVDTFIRETVPVVSELNPTRGDVFNFVPILPQSIEEAKVEEAAKATLPDQKYYGLTQLEWVYLAVAAVFLLVVLILVWRLMRMRQNLMALEEAIEDGQIFEQDPAGESALAEAKREKEERLARQEALIRDAIIQEKNDKTIGEIITQLLGRRDWAEQLFNDFKQDKQGIEKMTRCVAILGSATSRKLFAGIMGEAEYLEMEKMAEETKLEPEKDRELLLEIQKILYAKKLTSPEEIKSDPFAFLHELTTGQIAFLIRDEPSKIKSIVLSQLSSVATAEILSKLPKEERGKVIQQLGNMNELPLELAEKVAYNLADKAKEVPDDNTVGLDGVDMVVEAISESEIRLRKDMINTLRVSDRKLSEKVESRLFIFDSIPVVPQTVLTEVVRRLPPEDVIIAIVGATKNLQEKVILCFPEKNRRTLVASLKSQKPSPEMIKRKQKIIITAMQKMAAEKKVDLRKVQADWEKVVGRKPSPKSA